MEKNMLNNYKIKRFEFVLKNTRKIGKSCLSICEAGLEIIKN